MGWLDASVITRNQLLSEASEGPIVVEDYDATTLVPPDMWVWRDEWDNVVIDLKGKHGSL